MLKIIDKLCKQTQLIHHHGICDILCPKPYYGHKHGCPNYNKIPECPPIAPYVTDIIDTTKDVYLIALKYNLKEHVDNLKTNHQNWSFKQLHNCLYYQKGAKNYLFRYAEGLFDYSDKVLLKKPEANGVNIVAMMRKFGIRLKFPVVDDVWFVVIVGYSKKRRYLTLGDF